MRRNVKKRKWILYKDKRGLFALNDLLREEIYQKVQTEKKMEQAANRNSLIRPEAHPNIFKKGAP